MKDVRPIIGIAGKKHSGKDTVASIISYCYIKRNGSVDYHNWLLGYASVVNRDIAVHFADKIKDICSDLFGIPRFAFDDIDYKDNKLYLYDKKCFVNKVGIDYKLFEGTTNNITLSEYIEAKDGKVAFKVRTILQYIGTEIFRDKVSKDIWIRYAISRAYEVKNKFGICLIPDVRFNDEAKAIKNNGGIIIKVNRDVEFADKHSSEVINIDETLIDYTVNNNTSKFNLFYIVQGIYNQIFG